MERCSFFGLTFIILFALHCHGFPLDHDNVNDLTPNKPEAENKEAGIMENSSIDATSTEETTLDKESEGSLDESENLISSDEPSSEPARTTTEILVPVSEEPFVKESVRPLCSGDICVRYLKEIREDLEESRATPEDVEARSNREPVFDFEDTVPSVLED